MACGWVSDRLAIVMSCVRFNAVLAYVKNIARIDKIMYRVPDVTMSHLPKRYVWSVDNILGLTKFERLSLGN